MKTCIATAPSLNIAIKMQKILARVGIFAKIVSLDPSMSRRGCAYGVEFYCAEERTVKSALKREGIFPSQFIYNTQGRAL